MSSAHRSCDAQERCNNKQYISRLMIGCVRLWRLLYATECIWQGCYHPPGCQAESKQYINTTPYFLSQNKVYKMIKDHNKAISSFIIIKCKNKFNKRLGVGLFLCRAQCFPLWLQDFGFLRVLTGKFMLTIFPVSWLYAKLSLSQLVWVRGKVHPGQVANLPQLHVKPNVQCAVWSSAVVRPSPQIH